MVSIGSIHGGQAENVIPRHVDISGTLRYTELKVQKQVHAEIKRAFELVRPLGGEYELRFEIGNLPMVNHPEVVELIHLAAADLLGDAHVLPFKKELGAEDFACFTEKVPGAMFVLRARASMVMNVLVTTRVLISTSVPCQWVQHCWWKTVLRFLSR